MNDKAACSQWGIACIQLAVALLLALATSMTVQGQSINGIDDICFCRIYEAVNKSTQVFGGLLDVHLEVVEEAGESVATRLSRL
jgi:hypothetical protein